MIGTACGCHVTCGRTQAGAVYCWGDNVSGQLGDGTTTQRLVPTPVTGGIAFVEIRAGNGGACGLTQAGAAYCWGDDTYGEVGDGNGILSILVPTLVSGGIVFVEVRVGETHACGRTQTGAVYCWGDNNNGQLGDGTTTQRLVPTLVQTP